MNEYRFYEAWIITFKTGYVMLQTVLLVESCHSPQLWLGTMVEKLHFLFQW